MAITIRNVWQWQRKDRFNRDILKTSFSLLINTSYAMFNLILAWIYHSEWYLMMTVFLAPLCIIRFLILLTWKKDGADYAGRGILHVSGIILLLLDMQMGTIVYVSSIRCQSRECQKGQQTASPNNQVYNLFRGSCFDAQPATFNDSLFWKQQSGVGIHDEYYQWKHSMPFHSSNRNLNDPIWED